MANVLPKHMYQFKPQGHARKDQLSIQALQIVLSQKVTDSAIRTKEAELWIRVNLDSDQQLLQIKQYQILFNF